MLKHSYVTALVDLLLSGVDFDTALKNTKDLLDSKGHGRLWPAILQGVVTELEKRVCRNMPQIKVSSKKDQESEKINTSLKDLGVDREKTHEIDHDSFLIGGYILHSNDNIIDASYKKVLLDLYHDVTKA